jgi:hypothetical protein
LAGLAQNGIAMQSEVRLDYLQMINCR